MHLRGRENATAMLASRPEQSVKQYFSKVPHMQSRFKFVFALLCFCVGLAETTQAGIIATVDCSPFSGPQSGPASASCYGGDGNGSLSSANAQADYGDVIAAANSVWDYTPFCFLHDLAEQACEPNSSASASFAQMATFDGEGQGTLAVTVNGFNDFYGNGFFSISSGEGSAHAEYGGGAGGGPEVLTIPIEFGESIAIRASVSTNASDDSGIEEIRITNMQVFNSQGDIVDFRMIPGDTADYALTPEPATIFLFDTGLLGVTIAVCKRRRA
jgi:hypothetical protein